MRHRGLRECRLVTTLDEMTYQRPHYGCERCGHAAVEFLAHRVSQVLGEVLVRLGTDRRDGNSKPLWRQHFSAA